MSYATDTGPKTQTLKEIVKELKPWLEEIVREQVDKSIPHYLSQIVDRQRKDVADELVRILLEKAFTPIEEKIQPSWQNHPDNLVACPNGYRSHVQMNGICTVCGKPSVKR